jgi:hypothetical protein
MAKFSIPALVAVLGIGGASAFAPVSLTPNRISRTPLYMSSVAADTPPLAPLTVWGETIPDILESQRQLRSRPDIEFATTIKSSDLGLACDDTSGQLAYVKEHAMEIKQKMVDNGAGEYRANIHNSHSEE